MKGELKTHPEKPTLGSADVSPRAKKLWEDLCQIMRNEEAWFIIEVAFLSSFGRGSSPCVESNPVPPAEGETTLAQVREQRGAGLV